MNITIIGGTFNDEGGKPSGWVTKLGQAFNELDYATVMCNGGTWETLSQQLSNLPDQGVVCWFADVPNDKPKIVSSIKELHPKLFLVTSKRNLDNEYSMHDLVSRALALKANLLVEISGTRTEVLSTVLDPLCNVFLLKEKDINKVASALVNRLNTLMGVKRIGSKQVGEAILLPDNEDVSRFLDIVKSQAEVFHKIIHGVNTTRMLGNASFRCERGFPSFKNDGMIFVSQRNVDKRFIGPEAFVAVQQGKDGVEYYGPNKPSVDTPVQLALFGWFSHVKFMLHSHTYIEDAPFTQDVLPCGAIEEVEQILLASTDAEARDFAVNIKGHGSICLAESLDFFSKVNWVPRPYPEIIK
jgi:hypothetical protein